MKSHRSLPPLVEGKIHGYLRLVIDQVIWLKRNLGEIRVFASWWGETDSAEFRYFAFRIFHTSQLIVLNLPLFL